MTSKKDCLEFSGHLCYSSWRVFMLNPWNFRFKGIMKIGTGNVEFMESVKFHEVPQRYSM